ncbi:MAG: acyl-CoA synthetase FdrA [Ignavibacteria bacterium]|nr:acyl-CoA synthetase FdrA [Ignavibacteria bacterium]
MIFTQIKQDCYRDSVLLMQIAQKVQKIDGVKSAAVMMATEANKGILKKMGLLSEDEEAGRPSDLIISIKCDNAETAKTAIDKAISFLENKINEYEKNNIFDKKNYSTIQEAKIDNPGSNLSIISVPGEYAFAEARYSINSNLHVFLFSDNVSIDKEITLKNEAIANNKLMMGPDCGTSIIDGVPLGFANSVKRGFVGIVGASGTGIQEVSTLIDRVGFGISQAIGIGGRDLTNEVGGMMMIKGIDLLENDPLTKIIVIISKPPAKEIAEKVIERLKSCKKPVVLNFLGYKPNEIYEGISSAKYLEDVIPIIMRLLDEESISKDFDFWGDKATLEKQLKENVSKLNESQKYIRGLFSGGTLCKEANIIISDIVGENSTGLPKNMEINQLIDGKGFEELSNHLTLDLGDDMFTIGRPHPMIDLTLRQNMILAAANDSTTAAIVLDVVLGFGSHENPARELADTIIQAKEIANNNNRFLPVVAYVCGVEKDSQSLSSSISVLESAGAIVMSTNAQAAKMVSLIAIKEQTLNKYKVVTMPSVKVDYSLDGNTSIIGEELEIINVGLKGFYTDLKNQGIKVHDVDWKPSFTTNKKMIDKLTSII